MERTKAQNEALAVLAMDADPRDVMQVYEADDGVVEVYNLSSQLQSAADPDGNLVDPADHSVVLRTRESLLPLVPAVLEELAQDMRHNPEDN